jgi:DNA polymerase-3 subunit delta'
LEQFDYLKQLNTLNLFLKNVFLKNKSHAYLLVSEDVFELELAAKLFALQFVCENKHNTLPCFSCSACQKVLNNTAVDCFTYPKKTSIVVEEVKEIIALAQVKPFDFNKKIFVLNNIHEATLSAQNKLLKTLEEPPHDVVFILTAPSEKTVLPTIASRVTTIPLVRSKKDELEHILNQLQVDPIKKNITLDVAQGYIGKALNTVQNEVYFNVYHFCLNLVTNMNHSKKVLEFASVMEKNKKFISLYLEVLAMFYRDMLVLKENVQNALINKNATTTLLQASQNYSHLALLKILEKIEKAQTMITFNTNVTAIIDTLLLGILEVKYKWKTK